MTDINNTLNDAPDNDDTSFKFHNDDLVFVPPSRHKQGVKKVRYYDNGKKRPTRVRRSVRKKKETVPPKKPKLDADVGSEENMKLVSRENLRLMRKYLEHCELIYTISTCRGRKIGLSSFLVWNAKYNDNTFFPEITKEQFENYYDHIININKKSENVVKTAKSAISMFSDWLRKTDAYPDFVNVQNEIELDFKYDEGDMTPLSITEIKAILNDMKTRNDPIQKFVFIFALLSGTSPQTILELTVTEVTERFPVISGSFSQIPISIKIGNSVNFKKKRPDIFVVEDAFSQALDEYMTAREAAIRRKELVHDYLFIRETGFPLSVKIVNERYYPEWSAAAGRKVCGTVLKRTNTAFLMRYGVDRAIISAMQSCKRSLENVYDEVKGLYPDSDPFGTVGEKAKEYGVKILTTQ